jgi:hypothetical protein
MVNNGGSIVYIGSSSTLRPVPGFGLYTSSKLPASFLVGVLAQEIGERGITVNAVIATATDNAGYFTDINTNDDDPIRRDVEKASPIGSRMGSVDDIADAVEFFTGELARWISGQQLLVSGGAPSSYRLIPRGRSTASSRLLHQRPRRLRRPRPGRAPGSQPRQRRGPLPPLGSRLTISTASARQL